MTVERLQTLEPDDMDSLCEATAAAILDGGGFGWVKPPGRAGLQRYYEGLLMVPERILFAARLDGAIVGAVQLLRPARHMESQAMAAGLAHLHVAPYARGRGLGRALVREAESCARAYGYQVLNLDVRDTQRVAIGLFDRLGFERWGEHPAYARVDGRTVGGLFYLKRLQNNGEDGR